MSKTAVVSVVMATYNGEKFIEEQLLSICRQTRQPDEVIIRDDGSSDATPRIVEDFIKKNNLINWDFAINPVNLGFAQNFLQTAQKTSGDGDSIIFFSDQDDVWEDRKIELMAEAMENNAAIQALFCDKTYIDDKGNMLETKVMNMVLQVGEKTKLQNLAIFSHCRYQGGFLSLPAGMIMAVRKKCVLYSIKHFQSWPHSHDWKCAITASALGGLYFLNEVLARHRRHTTNVSVRIVMPRRSRIDNKSRYVDIRNLINFAEGYLGLLDYFKNDDLVEKAGAKRLLKVNKKRLTYYETKNLLAALFMFRYISKYYTLKGYLGDIVYLLGLEKYFN